MAIGSVIADKYTTIKFVERPHDVMGHYNSTIEVVRSGRTLTYNVGNLFRDQSLSLTYLGVVRLANGIPLIICNYAGQPSEGPHGFVIIKPTLSGYKPYMLPMTTYGKIVFSKRAPGRVQLWSANADSVSSKNEPSRYNKRLCSWRGEAYRCGRELSVETLFAPNDVIDPGIEIRP